jgi:hypothetical protein
MMKMERGLHYTYVDGMAITLKPEEVSAAKHFDRTEFSTRTHDDGWTISGEIHEDYVLWVNDFEATHPVYGMVRGNFEEEVFATSARAFKHFYERHTPEIWDYHDI